MIVELHAHAVGGENARRGFGKKSGVDAAVVGDGNGGCGKVCLEIVGVALRGLADGKYVHTVRARAEHAAQSAGTKFQLAVKPILDGGIVAADGQKLRVQRVVVFRFFQPLTIKSVSVHRKILPYSQYYRFQC